jgi:hypothetical protein
MRARKDDMIQPAHLTTEQWVASLQSEKRDLLAQVRREAHTRGNTCQRYLQRIDRALARAVQ